MKYPALLLCLPLVACSPLIDVKPGAALALGGVSASAHTTTGEDAVDKETEVRGAWMDLFLNEDKEKAAPTVGAAPTSGK